MNDEEKKLRRLKEQASAVEARRALDQGNAKHALSLIEDASEFWAQNLIVLLSVVGYHSNDVTLVKRASFLFHKQLALCSNPNSLVFVALWLRNPVRAKTLPDLFKTAIDNHRKKLEPAWNGIWDNPGVGQTNKSLALLKKSPNEVTEVDDCLVAASQAGNWSPWIHRYVSLGGSRENPVYLKLMVAKAVPISQKPSPRVKGLLKKIRFARFSSCS